MPRLKTVTHLTDQQHLEAARLLNQAQDNLHTVTSIVARAPFADQVLRISKAIQEILIDPLREGWEADPAHERTARVSGYNYETRQWEGNPYQSIGYGAPSSTRFVQRMKG